MKKVKFILFFIYCFCGYDYAQNVIFLKDGSKLRCKIVQEDSASLYYVLPHHTQQVEIKKSQVLSYSKKKENASPSYTYTEKPDKIILNFSGGLSNPLGDFASKDLNSSASGLAQKGVVFQASMVLKFSENIGACAAYQYQSNSFATNDFNNQLAAGTSGVSYTTRSTSWKIKGFYGGLYLTLPIRDVKGLSLFANGYIGLPSYITPEIATTAVSRNTGATVSVTQNSSSSSAAGFIGGAGLIYKFFGPFALHLSANYFSGKTDFTDVYISSSNGTFSYAHFTQKFESLNIQAGLSFIIN